MQLYKTNNPLDKDCSETNRKCAEPSFFCSEENLSKFYMA
jgi:hypothetical protein